MVSLFMGHLAWEGVPTDEKTVRSTANLYRADKPAAMAEDMPVQQELEHDPDPALGLASRQLASKWIQGIRDVPDWRTQADEVSDSFNGINKQQGISGTAASREAAGIVHPNLSYAVGIEAVDDLQDDNHKMGNDYFVRNDREVQATSDNTMMTVPPGFYHQSQASVIAHGKLNARDASAAGNYELFWNGGQ